MVRPEPEGLLKVRCRLTELAQHQAGRTEARERLGIVRIGAKSLTVDLLRLVKVAGLMIPPAARQRCSKLRHGPPSYHRILSYNIINISEFISCCRVPFVHLRPTATGYWACHTWAIRGVRRGSPILFRMIE